MTFLPDHVYRFIVVETLPGRAFDSQIPGDFATKLQADYRASSLRLDAESLPVETRPTYHVERTDNGRRV